MPYLETTTNEFLEIVCESAISDRKQKTVDDLLAKARKTLNKKLKTVADCDDYMAAIRSESTKFNECLKTLQVAKKKYDAGKIVPKDFDETVKAATMLLNKNCKQLQAKLGNFVDDKRAITEEEIAAFNAYVKGLAAIVKEISKQRKASAAKEAVDGLDFEMDFDPDTDFAMEGADEDDKDKDDDDEDDDKDEDDKKSKKKSKKSKKDDDEEDEDDDDDDDKKGAKESVFDDLELDDDYATEGISSAYTRAITSVTELNTVLSSIGSLASIGTGLGVSVVDMAIASVFEKVQYTNGIKQLRQKAAETNNEKKKQKLLDKATRAEQIRDVMSGIQRKTPLDESLNKPSIIDKAFGWFQSLTGDLTDMYTGYLERSSKKNEEKGNTAIATRQKAALAYHKAMTKESAFDGILDFGDDDDDDSFFDIDH